MASVVESESTDSVLLEIAGDGVVAEFLELCALLRRDPNDLATMLAREALDRHDLDMGAAVTVVVHRKASGGSSLGDIGDLEVWKLAFPGVPCAEDLVGLPRRFRGR